MMRYAIEQVSFFEPARFGVFDRKTASYCYGLESLPRELAEQHASTLNAAYEAFRKLYPLSWREVPS